MAAHVGVDTTYDLTTPTVGYTSEAESDQSVDTAVVKDENGNVVIAVPKKLVTNTQTIKGKGDCQLAAVTAGAFAAGTLKITSAKQTETADDFPDFEITGKKYSTLT
jgi:uncharacterized protein YtpQ (UPF0354 family)